MRKSRWWWKSMFTLLAVTIRIREITTRLSIALQLHGSNCIEFRVVAVYKLCQRWVLSKVIHVKTLILPTFSPHLNTSVIINSFHFEMSFSRVTSFKTIILLWIFIFFIAEPVTSLILTPEPVEEKDVNSAQITTVVKHACPASETTHGHHCRYWTWTGRKHGHRSRTMVWRHCCKRHRCRFFRCCSTGCCFSASYGKCRWNFWIISRSRSESSTSLAPYLYSIRRECFNPLKSQKFNKICEPLALVANNT